MVRIFFSLVLILENPAKFIQKIYEHPGIYVVVHFLSGLGVLLKYTTQRFSKF